MPTNSIRVSGTLDRRFADTLRLDKGNWTATRLGRRFQVCYRKSLPISTRSVRQPCVSRGGLRRIQSRPRARTTFS